MHQRLEVITKQHFCSISNESVRHLILEFASHFLVYVEMACKRPVGKVNLQLTMH